MCALQELDRLGVVNRRCWAASLTTQGRPDPEARVVLATLTVPQYYFMHGD